MYQWEEEEAEVSRKDSDGESTTEKTYQYEKTWSASHFDSSKFDSPIGHENPAELPFSSLSQTAEMVFVGEFQLPPDLVNKINKSDAVAVDVTTIPDELKTHVRPLGGTDTSATGIFWSSSSNSTPMAPEIGDVRVHFSATYPSEVSIMAEQAGNSFRPFETHAGRKLNMLSLGNVSAEAMIEKAETENTVLTWGLRVLGTVLMLLGIGFALRPHLRNDRPHSYTRPSRRTRNDGRRNLARRRPVSIHDRNSVVVISPSDCDSLNRNRNRPNLAATPPTRQTRPRNSSSAPTASTAVRLVSNGAMTQPHHLTLL